MPLLRVTASNFPATVQSFNGSHGFQVSRQRCLKFATTVGLSHLALGVPQPAARAALASYRALAVRCAVDFGQPSLMIDGEYTNFETSEKSNISFWIGMTFSAVVADHLLKVPKTIHAQQALGVQKAPNAPSRSLADLVGQDGNGNWHVIEAKARSSPPTSRNKLDWKSQAQTIAKVNGAQVSTRSYCFVHLSALLYAEIVDPPSIPRGPFELRMPRDTFGFDYYRPLIELLQNGSRVTERGGRSFVTRVVALDPRSNDYINLGLDNRVLDMARQNTFDFIDNEIDEPDFYVGRDGIAILTTDSPC